MGGDVVFGKIVYKVFIKLIKLRCFLKINF